MFNVIQCSARYTCGRDWRRRLSRDKRNCRGSINEFTAAIVIFILCFLIPLANLAAIPFRYLVAYAYISDLTHKLSLCERRSEALATVAGGSNFQELARKLGVNIDTCTMSFVCKTQGPESLTLTQNKPVPYDWLPSGSHGQCNYFLQTEVAMEIPPLISGGPKIAAITAPLHITVSADSPWENLGCDPATSQFYFNE